MKPGLFKRICLSVPFMRHRLAERTVQDHSKGRGLLDIVNRSVSYMIARNVVGLINSGKMDVKVTGDSEYHRRMIVEMFGNKANDIAGRIKCEKATVRSAPRFSVYLFSLPSSMDIGQSDIVAYVVNASGKAYSYDWEWSVNGAKMICAWDGDRHMNFGVCDSKTEFVKAIVELSEE